MTKEQIASNINDFFKEYDTYNYRDNVSHKIDEEETIEEIARISSGEVTEIAKAHAQELRKAS